MDFTPEEIKFIRTHVGLEIVSEKRRLGYHNMSIGSVKYSQRRIEIAQGILAKLKKEKKCTQK